MQIITIYSIVLIPYNDLILSSICYWVWHACFRSVC